MALNILPFFGRDKEKETVNWFLKHAETIESMAKPLSEILDAAFKKKDFELVIEKFKEINRLEKEADNARRTTATLLYEGAFLPTMRSRLYGLSGRMDDIADAIKNVCNMLHYLKGKKVPQGTVAILFKLGDNAVKAAGLTKLTLQALFDNKQEFTTLSNQIKDLEEKSDIYQREMFDKILFDKNMNPVTVQIIGWVGHSLSEVCDNAKHATDTMTLLKIMKVA
jgi:predicted phosphate transport protein (TIGR00153 family)